MLKPIVALLVAGVSLAAADWSSTSLGYRYGTQFREPGIDGTVEKNILQLTHASGWAHGSNFFNADLLMSDPHDPSNNGTTGASEVYVVYRGALGLGRLAGRDLGFGPVRDVSLTFGFDFNSKNTAFAPKKRFLVLGPTLNFKLADGFWDLGIWACHEQNYNGIVGRAVDFRTTFVVSTAWGVPFQLGAVGAEFRGFANYVGAKGKDGFGADTKPETLANLSLLFDLGAAFGSKQKLLVGGGLEYWNNKFGGANHNGPAPLTNRRVLAPMAQLQFRF